MTDKIYFKHTPDGSEMQNMEALREMLEKSPAR